MLTNLNKIMLALCLFFSLQLAAQVPDKIFNKVEKEAAFPGGDPAWRKYLVKNLNPNVPIDNGAVMGLYTVIVKFVVSTDGSISGIEAETNLGYGMEKEVMRIIKNSGNWEPAYQDGKTVNAYRRQPVTFSVEDPDVAISSAVPFTLFTAVDNEISIRIRKVKADNMDVSISQGTIRSTEDGKFIVRVNKPGRVIITVNNKKNGKELTTISFEVRNK